MSAVIIRNGETYFRQFTIRGADQAPVVADALPTATLIRNGLDTATVVTVVDNGGGQYELSFLPVGIAEEDVFQFRINALVAGLAIRTIADIAALIVIGFTYSQVVLLRDARRAPVEATGTPTAVVVRNNAVDGNAPVTVSQNSPHLVGEYVLTFTAPSATSPVWIEGDEIELNIAAVVEGVSISRSTALGQVFDTTAIEVPDFIVTEDVQDIVLNTDDEDIALETDDLDIQVELD